MMKREYITPAAEVVACCAGDIMIGAGEMSDPTFKVQKKDVLYDSFDDPDPNMPHIKLWDGKAETDLK